MTEKKPAAAPAANTVDPHLVEKLGEIATRLDLSEIEVAQGELKIRVARQGGALLVGPASGTTALRRSQGQRPRARTGLHHSLPPIRAQSNRRWSARPICGLRRRRRPS